MSQPELIIAPTQSMAQKVVPMILVVGISAVALTWMFAWKSPGQRRRSSWARNH